MKCSMISICASEHEHMGDVAGLIPVQSVDDPHN